MRRGPRRCIARGWSTGNWKAPWRRRAARARPCGGLACALPRSPTRTTGPGKKASPSSCSTARILPDGTAPALKWTGVRAPVIADKDDGSWKEGKPIELFNGKDLTGWQPLNPGAEMKWSYQGGILRNAPPTTDLISEQKFWNFKLHEIGRASCRERV